jgi:hypothetical protein
MAFELRENNVMVFANKEKRGLKSPVVTGKANVEGTLVKLAGWDERQGDGIVGKLTVKEGDQYQVVGTVSFKDNTGSTNEKAPDKVGTLELNNRTFRLALWKKEGANGTYLSGRIQDPEKAVQVSGTSGSSPTGRTPIPTAGGNEDIF